MGTPLQHYSSAAPSPLEHHQYSTTAAAAPTQTIQQQSGSSAYSPAPQSPQSVASSSTTKLNPHSAAFSFLQPDLLGSSYSGGGGGPQSSAAAAAAYSYYSPTAQQPTYAYPPLLSGYTAPQSYDHQPQYQAGWKGQQQQTQRGAGNWAQPRAAYYQPTAPPPRPSLHQQQQHPSHNNGIYLPLPANGPPLQQSSPTTQLLPPFSPSPSHRSPPHPYLQHPPPQPQPPPPPPLSTSFGSQSQQHPTPTPTLATPRLNGLALSADPHAKVTPVSHRRARPPPPSLAPALSVGPNVRPPPEYKSRFPVAAEMKASSSRRKKVEHQKTKDEPVAPVEKEKEEVAAPTEPSTPSRPTPSVIAPSPAPTTANTEPSSSSTAPTSPLTAASLSSTTPPTTTLPTPSSSAVSPPSSPALTPAVLPSTPASASASAAAPTTTAPATPKSPPPSVWGAPGAVKKSWASLLRSPSAPAPILANGQPAPSIIEHIPPPLPASKRSLASTLSALDFSPSALEKQPAVEPRGLVNNGNLCFANAILQVLVYCMPLRGLLGEVRKGTKVCLGGSGKDEAGTLEAMIAFLEEFRIINPGSSPVPTPSGTPAPSAPSTPGPSSASHTAFPLPGTPSQLRSNGELITSLDPFLPQSLYASLRPNHRFDAMTRGQQEDAEEFLGFFLDTLHEELLRVVDRADGEGSKKGKEKAGEGEGDGWEEVGSKGRTATTRTTETRESPITKIFGGQLRSVLRCSGQKDSITLEPYQRLQLDIQPSHVRTIADALSNLTLPEPLPDFLSRSGLRVEATKQVYLETFPPVLILHLKRFLYDNVGGVQKSGKRVGYGTELEIGEEVVGPTKRTGRRVKYQLFGVVYHHGMHASGGHYTVAVRQQINSNSWLHIDDTTIRPISPAEVAVGPETPNNASAFHNDEAKGAYLLLYSKMN